MSSTDLHRNDNELTHDAELRAETSVDIRVAERETDSAICRDDFEEYREEIESYLIWVLNAISFRDGDNEETQEDVPQVKGQLTTQMGADVGWFFVIFVVFLAGGVDP